MWSIFKRDALGESAAPHAGARAFEGLRMVQLPYLVAPGEDPGIYRRAFSRVRLWTVEDSPKAPTDEHAECVAQSQPVLIGEILRPRERSLTISSRKQSAGKADDDRFPDTELVSVSHPLVSASVGVASGEVNGSVRYFRFVDLAIEGNSPVIAEAVLRPQALGTKEIEHAFSDLVYLSKKGAFVVLDCSAIDPASIASFSRGWIPRLVQQLTDRHQNVLPVLGASTEVQHALSGLSSQLAFCDSLAQASNVFRH